MATDPSALTPLRRRAELAALASGLWSRWGGLDPAPTVDEVADQLGQPLEPQAHSGMFGGSPTIFRRYAGADDGPLVVVWFEGDVAVGVEIDDPRRSPIDDPLGPPGEVLDSEVGDGWEQHVYGERGLVLHVRHSEHGVVETRLLYGLAPFDSTAFSDDPLRWEGRRERFSR